MANTKASVFPDGEGVGVGGMAAGSAGFVDGTADLSEKARAKSAAKTT
jgi:hypothetical protein